MIGEKFFRKSNLVECLVFTDAKLVLYTVTNSGTGENGFPTFTLEYKSPIFYDKIETTTILDNTLARKYIHAEDYQKLMEFIGKEQEKIENQIKKITKEVLSMT